MNIFSFDSKVTNVFAFIADLFILNIVYLSCCIPIVTIGAAQAGLHTAMRVLVDPNDDNSVLKAFFRGFKSGFLTVSGVHVVFLALDGILLHTLITSYSYREENVFISWQFPLVMLIFCLILHALVPLFHSQFSSKPFHLFRNSVLLFISRPIRSLGVGILIWAPLVLFLLMPNVFTNVSVVFFTVYYSVAFAFCSVIMQKPFKLMIQEINPDEVIEEIK